MIDRISEWRGEYVRGEYAQPEDTGSPNQSPHDEMASRPGAGGAVAEVDRRRSEYQPVFADERRQALEYAARWLWRDGRPRAAVGPDRQIVWCNPAARRLLVAPGPLVIEGDRLCPATGVDIAQVDAFLERLDSSSSRLQVTDADTDRGVLLTAWADIVDGQQLAFIEFGLRELPFDCRESGMADAFGLTKAECRIVDALAVMEAPSRIAERLGVSVHTVRTHIRRIYGKMKVRSQLHFMRLTMAYCGG